MTQWQKMQPVTLVIILLSSAVLISAHNPLSDEYINNINRQQSLWKAGRNFHPDTPIPELQGLLGVVEQPSRRLNKIYRVIGSDIPESFDSRENWKDCASIKTIYDQANCGSCWAVSTASAMTDRLCIHSQGQVQVRVSARNLMSCCTECGDGCNGGWPSSSWEYWRDVGIVTGGVYNSTDGCQSYPYPECEHHGTSGSRPACKNNSDAPKCEETCDEGVNATYVNSLTLGKYAYSLLNETEQIQLEIWINGPVIADFTVYADFFSYKSGVYKRTTDEEMGRHAVRVIGWGVENDTPYWLISNSWNTDWGMDGVFKILRGENECGIEEEVTAGIPDV